MHLRALNFAQNSYFTYYVEDYRVNFINNKLAGIQIHSEPFLLYFFRDETLNWAKLAGAFWSIYFVLLELLLGDFIVSYIKKLQPEHRKHYILKLTES